MLDGEMRPMPPRDRDHDRGRPSIIGQVASPALLSLAGALIALVIVDIAVTITGARRSHNRGDRIIETQIDIAARLGRIESALTDR